MKLLFFVATIVMFLGFTAGSYGLAIVYISSSQREPVAVGEQMHLNVQIEEGRNVSGYELTVNFDPTALRYIEAGNADYLPVDAFVVSPIVTENTVHVAATSGAEVVLTSEGTLATLTFEVIAAKGSIIKLIDVTLSDSAGMPLPVTSENGRIVAIELPPNWDVNEDGRVNILDLTLVASNLMVGVLTNPRVDVNRDGKVNILDLVLIAQNLDAGGNKDRAEAKVHLVIPARFISANPPSGSRFAANTSIVVNFNNDPGDVTTSVGSVSGSGKSRTITGPFIPGALALSIAWTNGHGSYALTYTVVLPDTIVPNVEAPKVIGGTVKDDDDDVDPAEINSNGIIMIEFDETVTGSIALQTKGGDDVGWIGRVDGNKGILELVKKKEISAETTYVIVGTVFDAAGNRTDIRITFVTK